MEDYHKTVNAYSGQADKFQKFYTNYNSEKERSRLRDEGARRLASNAHDEAVKRAQSALGLSQEEASAFTEQMVMAGTTGQALVGLGKTYRTLRKGKPAKAKGDGKADGKDGDSERLDDAPAEVGEEAPMGSSAKVLPTDEAGEAEMPTSESMGLQDLPVTKTSLFGPESDAVAGADFAKSPTEAFGGKMNDEANTDGRGGMRDEVGENTGAEVGDAEKVGEKVGEEVGEKTGAELGADVGGEVAVDAVGVGEALGAVIPEALPLLLAVGGIGYGLSKILGKDKGDEEVANSTFTPPVSVHSGTTLARNTIYSQSAEFTIPTYDSVTDISPSVTAW